MRNDKCRRSTTTISGCCARAPTCGQEFMKQARLQSARDVRGDRRAVPRVLPHEVIGALRSAAAAGQPALAQGLRQPKWTGYEVVLDVFPDVFAYGILLLPKDLKPGEKRPVVVCQHGLEGRPQDIVDGRQPGLPRLRRQAGRARLHHLRAAEPVHLRATASARCSARPIRWGRRCSRSSCRSISRSSTG